MKTFISLLFLTLQISVYSQFQFNYSYTFKEDSTKLKSHTDVMSVVVDQQKRFYLPQGQITKDTLFVSLKNRPKAYMEVVQDHNYRVTNYGAFTDLEKNDITHYIFTYNSSLFLKNNFKFPDWELTDEQKTIDNRVLKKAITYYQNRKWTAWYSEELPIQVAPYIFYGLPGVIIELSDENKLFVFELLNYKTQTAQQISTFKSSTMFYRRNDFKEVSLKDLVLAGISERDNKLSLLEAEGVQIEEDRRRQIEKNRKLKKNIYLNPIIPYVL